jgi:hypothetical protein
VLLCEEQRPVAAAASYPALVSGLLCQHSSTQHYQRASIVYTGWRGCWNRFMRLIFWTVRMDIDLGARVIKHWIGLDLTVVYRLEL